MSWGRRRTERRLRTNAERLRAIRDELAVIDEQLLVVGAHADEAAVRSLVSDSPLAAAEDREAGGELRALRRSRERLAAELAQREARQDELLDNL